MVLQSLAWRTDIALAVPGIVMADRGDYIVVQSEIHPDHIWKNFVLFPNLPTHSDISVWRDIYEREFPGRAETFSVAFGWDHDDEGTGFETALLEAGFWVHRCTEYIATAVSRPSSLVKGLQISPVREETTWQRILERRVSRFCTGRHRDVQVRFEHDKFETYRNLARRNLGDWYVGHLGGREIGDMGLFIAYDGIARFQEVWVYPEDQNAGLGKTMVYCACRDLAERQGPQAFLAVTEDDVPSNALYRAVGFRPNGVQARAHWTVFF
jgi:RimJ/RimL family protein N-acetyltransferase